MAKAKSHAVAFKYAMICDDVRRERNGKEIIIGVYNDVIVANKIPLHKNRLSFRLVFGAKEERELTFAITDPDGEQLAVTNGNIAVHDSTLPCVLVIVSEDIEFPKFGRYGIHFGEGDEPEKVWEFEVRQREKDGKGKAQSN